MTAALPKPDAYREDIDQLRGLAVLMVVAFHFEVPAIHAGYIGVDIFFVISGFLITQIIQRELRAGTFSFAQFYERRVRRLLPPLYVMVLATTIPAFHYLLTSERLEYFRSIASVVTFTSNFFFWLQSGYFDVSAVEKPLLHTWSLAVEEQFYLVLPVCLWSLFCIGGQGRRGKIVVAATLAGAAAASFAYALWLIRTGHTPTAFYMSGPRAWEFLIGGIVALEGFPVLSHNIMRATALVLGYVLIFAAMFGLRKASSFPGLNAVAPCLGAALFIWSGTGVPSVTGRRPYSIFAITWFFGRISYSLYLWHWPVFAFARFSKDGLTLDPVEKVLLFALTVGIAYLSWRFVELPFRRRTVFSTRRSVFAAAGVASLALLLLCGADVLFGNRFSSSDRDAEKLEAYNNFDERAAYRGGVCFRYEAVPFDEAHCLALAPDRINILLWGDSYAAHYYPGLLKILDPHSVNLMQATQAGCTPTLSLDPDNLAWCNDFTLATAPWLETKTPDMVVMSGDWIEPARRNFDAMAADIRNTAAVLNARGIAVVLFGPSVQFKDRLPPMLIRAHLRHADPLLSRDVVRPDIFDLDARMKAALPSSEKFTYVSVLDAVCPEKVCPVTIGDGVPLAWDFAHLTIEGSDYVVGKLAPQLRLPELAASGVR
jgi:peptidoglycan/LPS O-acetylase OafA/YrhL